MNEIELQVALVRSLQGGKVKGALSFAVNLEMLSHNVSNGTFYTHPMGGSLRQFLMLVFP